MNRDIYFSLRNKQMRENKLFKLHIKCVCKFRHFQIENIYSLDKIFSLKIMCTYVSFNFCDNF